jgi:uncharacterized protein
MLELRPTCEHCDTPLPPASTEAMICSFECTFCHDCVQQLQNVCPNCGGGFTQRPVRPVHDWVGGNTLGNHPASTKVIHKPVDLVAHVTLVGRLNSLAPAER